MAVDLQIHMDYGHFYLRGRREFDWDGWLVEQANSTPPSAYTPDGDALVVLSPHQWSFKMPMSVELVGSRPASDRDDWQQVSECRLRIDTPGVLQIDSPLSSYATCTVPPGRYVAEVSGRGFFANHYRHDASDMADEWRTRLWPDEGDSLEPSKIFPAS